MPSQRRDLAERSLCLAICEKGSMGVICIMGTLDSVLMLGALGIGAYIIYVNWGNITAGMQGGGGGGGFFQQVYAQEPTFEQPEAVQQIQGDCAAAGTGVCCTDNAGNKCYKGSTVSGVKYTCDDDGSDADCTELRDKFAEEYAVDPEEVKKENTPKPRPSGKTNPAGHGGCASGDRACGLCYSQGGTWQPGKKCCACAGKKISQVKCCTTTPAKKKAPAPKSIFSGQPGGPKPTYVPAGQFKYRTNIAGYPDPYGAFEESLQGSPPRCNHLIGSPAAYHMCLTNSVNAYNYGPQDGTFQDYADLDQYGSYSTYWTNNPTIKGRAPMRLTLS